VFDPDLPTDDFVETGTPNNSSNLQATVENFIIIGTRDRKESVAYFGPALDPFHTRGVLPERDRPVFVQLMQQKLHVSAGQEQLADHL